jgi:hypothetical protein
MKFNDYNGKCIGIKDDYFVSVPKELGTILSGHTSLQKNVKPNSTMKMTILNIATLIGSYLLVTYFFKIYSPFSEWKIVFSIIIPFISTIICMDMVSFRHSCSYVGETGSAYYEVESRRGNIKVENIFTYNDADELKIKETTETRGPSTKHTFNYDWYKDDKLIHSICGHKHEPKYKYAKAVNNAWSKARESQQNKIIQTLIRDKLKDINNNH